MLRVTKLGFIALGFVLLAACVPNRKVVLAQDQNPENVQEINNMYFVDEPVDNAIRQGDELYLNISSADENETVFDKNTDQRIYDPALLSYTVDEEGYIKLPYVNKVKLSGLHLDEAATKILEKLCDCAHWLAVHRDRIGPCCNKQSRKVFTRCAKR